MDLKRLYCRGTSAGISPGVGKVTWIVDAILVLLVIPAMLYLSLSRGGWWYLKAVLDAGLMVLLVWQTYNYRWLGIIYDPHVYTKTWKRDEGFV